MKKIDTNWKKFDVISSSKCISSIFEEEEFEDDFTKILEELTLHIDGDGANVNVELHSREIYEEVLGFSKRLGIVDSPVVLQEAIVYAKYKIMAKKIKPLAT